MLESRFLGLEFLSRKLFSDCRLIIDANKRSLVVFFFPQSASGSRLPVAFKTFDFFDEATRAAVSAKPLDTTTPAKIANPTQVYSSIKRNIDEVLEFTSYELRGVRLEANLILNYEVHMAIPKDTALAQWVEIDRAAKYAEQ
jgi:filamentous hemagglutinin